MINQLGYSNVKIYDTKLKNVELHKLIMLPKHNVMTYLVVPYLLIFWSEHWDS